MTPDVMRKTGLAILTAAAIFGAAQALALPARVGAQTAPDGGVSPSGTISATGIGQVPGDTAEQAGGALMMSIEERSNGTDVQGAVKTVQDRIARLRSALTAAGIPDSAIHVQGFNVGPQYGYPYPVPMPVEPDGGAGGGAVPPSGATTPARPIAPPEPTGYVVNAQLMADTTGPEQLATAMRVAIDNGATNVNSFIKGGPGNPTPPSPEALAPAIQRATAQAKAMAEASAEAAGVTLGAIDSVAVLAPTPSYGGGPGPIPTVAWQVQVRVTYRLQ
ncbi:MAG: SIMPL domain-containing protein [Dehalococcoidia bacterium]